MGETSDQIERQIETARGRLGEDLSELQSKVKDATDWRWQFDRHPKAALAVAFGAGMTVALLTADKASNGMSPADEIWASTSSEPSMNGKHRPSELWQDIKHALLGLSANRLTRLFDELIPGFEEELSKTRRL